MFLVVRTPRKTVEPVFEERQERLETPLSALARDVSAISRIRLGRHWELRTL